MTPLKSATRSDIAITNLSSQIDSIERQVSSLGMTPERRVRLFELLSVRVQFLGTFSDLRRMDELAREQSGDAELRTRFLLLTHEFAGAEESLSDTSAPVVLELQQTLDLALHRNLDAQRDAAEEQTQSRPSFETWASLGAAQAALGLFDEADASFESAEDAYGDVSPFPLAWLSFQRGLMWSEQAGREDVGERYYRRSLEYLPEYVVANVHLAELLGDDEAELKEELLLRAAQGEDPEPVGKLATFYEGTESERSEEYRSEAAAGYDTLLESFPLAFADHGSEFFREPGGDPERALTLASQNLENRPTPRAQLLVWAALEEKGSHDELCASVEERTELDAVHPVLAEERTRLQASCR